MTFYLFQVLTGLKISLDNKYYAIKIANKNGMKANYEKVNEWGLYKAIFGIANILFML